MSTPSETTSQLLRTVTLTVPEMDCPPCVGKVTKSVERLNGIDGLDPQITTGTLVVAFDPERTSEDAVVKRVQRAGYDVEQPAEENTRTTQFSVPAMDCPSCAKKVSNALEKVEGITELDLQPTTGTAAVTYNPDRVSKPTLIDAIEGVGYDITDSTTDESRTSSPTVAAAEDIWTSSRAIKT